MLLLLILFIGAWCEVMMFGQVIHTNMCESDIGELAVFLCEEGVDLEQEHDVAGF